VTNAASETSGIWATLIGIATLIVTASGVFGEMQTSLNVIWKAEPKGTTVSRLIRARAASLGLVVVLGFLLMVSLVVSTGLTAFGDYLNAFLPFGKIILTTASCPSCSSPSCSLRFTRCCRTAISNGATSR
jgi:membrane protein